MRTKGIKIDRKERESEKKKEKRKKKKKTKTRYFPVTPTSPHLYRKTLKDILKPLKAPRERN